MLKQWHSRSSVCKLLKNMNNPADFPVREPVWSGVVLRAPNTVRSEASRPAIVDDTELASLPSPYRLVNETGLLGVIAPTREIRDQVVSSLKIRWPAKSVPTVRERQLPPEDQLVYRWPSGKEVPPDEYHSPLACWDGQRLIIWTGCQERATLRRDVSRLLNLDENAIEVRPLPGDNSDDDFGVSVDAAMLARHVSFPVRVERSSHQRRNQFQITYSPRKSGAADAWRITPNFVLSTPFRPDIATLTASGDANAARHSPGNESEHVIYDGNFEVSLIHAAHVSHAATDERAAAIASAFARESFVDELARSEGVDPVEWRLRNLSDNSGRDVIAEVASRANWAAKQDSNSFTGKGRGFAYASSLDYSEAVPKKAWSAWVVDLSVDPANGRVSIDRITVGHNIQARRRTRRPTRPSRVKLPMRPTNLCARPGHLTIGIQTRWTLCGLMALRNR